MPNTTYDTPPTAENLAAWLEAEAKAHGLTTLLAFADDGVVWGRIEENGKLLTAYEAVGSGAALRPITLQEARLFGEDGEVLVWKTRDGFKARYLTDHGFKTTQDERMLLWGDTSEGLKNGFSLLRDGAQGMAHAVPFEVKPGTSDRNPATPPRLVVRHLIEQDETTGMARIAASRLVRLEEDTLPAL